MNTFLPLCLAAAVLCAVIAPAAAEETPVHAYSATPFSIRLLMYATFIELYLTNNENSMTDMVYEPDAGDDYSEDTTPMYFGIELHYKHIGIGFKQTLLFGEKKNVDVTLSYILEQFAAQAYFRNYHGFRLVDHESLGMTPAEDRKYTVRPDLKIWNTGLNLYYMFSDDFVFYGPLNPSAVQKQSAGSWMIKLSPYMIEITSDYPLIPESLRSGAPNNGGFTGGNYYGINMLAGYGYTFLWRNFYFTPALLAGGGPQYQDANSHGKLATITPAFDIDISCALGFQGKDYFMGVWFVNENSFIYLKDFLIQMLGGQIEYFAGMRF